MGNNFFFFLAEWDQEMVEFNAAFILSSPPLLFKLWSSHNVVPIMGF